MMDRKVGVRDSEEAESVFEEIDPTGRYGRYKEVLGKGAFKTVYRAFDELEGMEVAWNQVKVHDVLQTSEDLERLYSEVHLLKTVKHKNIIKFYTSWVDDRNDNINFITEIFTSGTLRQYRRKHKHVDMRAVKNWSCQILRGLLYLHSHDPPIIHRDLKCDNIFVNGNQGEVKIGDLGLAAIVRQAHAAHSVIGTPEFMAPELYEEEYNELVDIYSFGMCLLEMVTFEYPYSECANAAQIYKKVTSGVKPAALDKVKDPEVRAFIEKCLVNASVRLPAIELLMDPFLQCEGGEIMDHMSHPKSPYYGHNLGIILEKPSLVSSSSEAKSLPKVEVMRNSKTEKDLELLEHSNLTIGSHMQSEMASEDNFQELDDCKEIQDISSNTNEEGAKTNRDFTVKGQRKDDNTIFLRLRIADLEGHVRNIHFPFNIDIDTAMTVASEMVTELDLSDQDVTNIAVMIDAEILALVPDWKPGVAFVDAADEDFCNGCESFATDDDASYTPNDDDATYTTNDFACRCAEFVLERLPSGRKYWSDSPRSLCCDSCLKTAPTNLASKTEGLIHNRFEEVNYEQSVYEQSVSSSDMNCCDQSNCTVHSDNHDDDENNSDANMKPSKEESESVAMVLDSPQVSDVKMSLGNMERNDNAQEECEATNRGSQYFKDYNIGNNLEMYVFEGKEEDITISTESAETLPDTTNIFSDLDVEDESSIVRKLEFIILKQREELEGLRQKHQRAIQDFLNRLPNNDYALHFLSNGFSMTPSYIYHISINASALKNKASNDANSMSCKKDYDETFNKKSSLEVFENSTSVIGKDAQHEVSCKDFENEAEKKNLMSGIVAQHGQTVKQAGFPLDKIVKEKETKKVSSKGMGPVELSSLWDSRPKMETVGCGTDTSRVEKCLKQNLTDSHVKMSNHTPNVTASICNYGSHDVDKVAKRDSVIEFYKGMSPLREKSNSSKGEVKFYGMDTKGLSRSSSNSKTSDNVLEQLKKEQLQKSIADLEAKTLEGLKSKGGYLTSSSVKKHSGNVSQAGSVGSNALGTRHQAAPETTKV